MDLALSVEGVGKRYRLGEDRGGYDLLAETVENKVRAPLNRLLGRRPEPRPEPPDQTLWALKDVSFDLHHGEALGLIGRNGAGKSTLLKIISRISPPTEGRVVTYGRLGTLLEVGTGFHPELTGRENIYLNGTIIGMRRREIEERFDEIVDFSGIERFLDTPVKRYSSGMYVRLAFAVAAHLEPEILIVDEVLAVGDAEFQKKCINKMKSVAVEGRAIVFVSHNAHFVQRLCTRAILLESGRAVVDGDPAEVVADYYHRIEPDQAEGVSVIPGQMPRFGDGAARLHRVVLTDLDGTPQRSLKLGQPFRVSATYEVFEEIAEATVEIGLSTVDGLRVATMQSVDGDRPPMRFGQGTQTVTMETDVTLLPGEYAIDVALHPMSGKTADHVDQALHFTGLNVAEEGEDHYPWHDVRGYVRPRSSWDLVEDEVPGRLETEVT